MFNLMYDNAAYVTCFNMSRKVTCNYSYQINLVELKVEYIHLKSSL